MESPNSTDLARSLYLHFPFCEVKCHYCDFYSIATQGVASSEQSTKADQFRNSLLREIELSKNHIAPFLDTIFMGGGTPSMTSPQEIALALQPLWNFTQLTEATEWTMEANPSSVSLQSLKDYRSLGVNRVSLGVQSLDDSLLKKLGRVHNQKTALRALDAIIQAGFTNFSVDLLCGVPGQTLKDLEISLEKLFEFPLTHLSCYLLTLPQTHRMFRDLPKDDVQLEHLLFIDEWLTSRGFEHYEISNFCTPGKPAQHNLNYWKGISYLGFGPSAHSYDAQQKKRWKNYSSLNRYAKALQENRLPIEWSETLSPKEQQLEKWMLALRLSEGFPKKWLEKDFQKSKVENFETLGLLTDHPEHSDRIRLTPKGFALSEKIIVDLAHFEA